LFCGKATGKSRDWQSRPRARKARLRLHAAENVGQPHGGAPLGAMVAGAHRFIQLCAVAIACCEKVLVDLIRFSLPACDWTGYPDI